MALFRYRARGPRGDAIEGTQEAASAEAVAGRLIEGGLVPIDIQVADDHPAASRDLRDLFPGRVGLADLILFSRQMYSLVRAGVPMLTALNGLAATSRNRSLARALGEVVQMLEAGHDLATALNHQPEVFSDFYVSMVRVGETSGQLEDIFRQLTYYLEREKKTRDQVRAAVRYPLFVLVMITIAIGIINVFVVPAFAQIFERFDAELPLATRIVIALSDFTVDYWHLLLGGLIGAVAGLRMYLATEDGRYRWHRAMLRLPLIGDVLYRAALSRFARLFGISQRAGVPLITALTVVARALGNDFLRERVLGMREGIERGEAISHTAAGSGMFDPLVLQMMAVGEQSGTVDELLLEIARYYDQEVEYAIERLSAGIGPLLTIFIGLLLLVLAVAVLLPWWDLATVALSR